MTHNLIFFCTTETQKLPKNAQKYFLLNLISQFDLCTETPSTSRLSDPSSGKAHKDEPQFVLTKPVENIFVPPNDTNHLAQVRAKKKKNNFFFSISVADVLYQFLEERKEQLKVLFQACLCLPFYLSL